MLRDSYAPSAPETPDYWRQLEKQLAEAAVRGLTISDIHPTPRYEGELDRHLVAHAPAVARRESLPLGALAAAAAAVVLVAAFLVLSPSDSGPITAATPGNETTTTVAAAVSAEQLVVTSFERWVDGRTDAERLENRYRNQGYDVAVQRLAVTEPSLNGQVIEVRHAAATTGTTLSDPGPRGQVTLVVGRTIAAGENISG